MTGTNCLFSWGDLVTTFLTRKRVQQRYSFTRVVKAFILTGKTRDRESRGEGGGVMRGK